MKNILFLLILTLFSKIGMAQYDFIIEDIIVSRVIEQLGENVLFAEDFGEGPFIHVKCLITNNSKDSLVLTANSEFAILFNYNNTQYSQKVISMYLSENYPIIILPFKNHTFTISINLLLGCDFYKRKGRYLNNIRRIDHTKEVIAILPTLKVRYKDKNIDITTDEIKNVTVEDIPYIY